MPSTFTTNTGIEKIGDGEQSGLWGQTTNLNFDIVDRALNGVGSITLTGTTHTLTTTNGTLSDGQFAVLIFSGSPSGANTVTISPDTAEKLYWARNDTAQNVILSQGSGTTVTLAPGESKAVAADGGGSTASVIDLTSAFVTLTGTQTLTNKTVEKLILNDGYTEEVFAVTDGATVNLDPNNGSIQTWTLGANRTPDQANWAAGQSITLLVDDGSAHTITWTTLAVVWKTDGGTAPTLELTGFTVIVLWKVGTTIYGARVGDA
jgi:hypothetical protein